MERIALFTSMISLLTVIPAFAEINISDLDVKAVISNEFIVRYSWKIDVYFSEDRPMNCKLKILFFDANGSEIHSKSRPLSLSHGTTHLTGHGVCKPEVWKKIKEYKAHIKCP